MLLSRVILPEKSLCSIKDATVTFQNDSVFSCFTFTVTFILNIKGINLFLV